MALKRTGGLECIAFSITLLGLLLAKPARAQLGSSLGAWNPLAGQWSPPIDSPDTGPDGLFPVNTQVLIASLLAVNENGYNFDINFYWFLSWNDSRAEDIIMNTNYTTCTFYCSSRPSTLQNNFGQNACCTGVYVPQAEGNNLVGYDSQSMPYRYTVSLGPGGEVTYFVQVQGTWSCSFNYGAYPWDRHYLNMDIYTSFFPVVDMQGTGSAFISTDGVVVESQDVPGRPQSVSNYRPSVTSLQLPGWAVGSTSVEAMNFTDFVSTSSKDFQDGSRTSATGLQLAYFTPGLRVGIEINRITKAFHAIIIILPIALITLFSFGIFSMSRTALKARVNLLATQFLTLIILQFVLSDILPASFSLIAPYYLILVAYVYTFLLFMITVASNALLNQYTRREKRHMRMYTRNHFKMWRNSLYSNSTTLRHRRSLSTSAAAANGDLPTVGAPNGCWAGKAERLEEGGDGRGPEDDGEGGLDKEREEEAPAHSFVPGRDPRDNQPWRPTEMDFIWYQRQQQQYYWKITALRRIAMFHKFIGLPGSRDYSEYLSHKFEAWARGILLILFLAVTGIIFGVAASRTQSAADVHVLPSQATIQLLEQSSGGL